MPVKPKRPCRYSGCPNLCDSGVYCEEHRKEWSHDALRGGAYVRGYDARWRKARALYLRQHPLCAECRRDGALTPATVVDHIVPHRGDKVLFWDQQNWQPLCKGCHDRKTGNGW
jgi:5-methylcytosine-specific restriction protein A